MEIDAPPVPIFSISQLPQLTPTVPRLPSAIDVDTDDDGTPPH